MARKTLKTAPLTTADFTAPKRVTDSPLFSELETSFLEFSVSAVSRALPDARDGMKTVHRRIIHAMNQAGLRPDKPHVKSARVVGDVMANLHPHGDMAIYDTMVRLAQDHQMSVMLIDGKGNWGGPGASAAASRYTEARLTGAALTLADETDEDTVLMVPNYDGKTVEPSVLPSGFPNLVVNGNSGMGVGYACNLIPHSLGEVAAATAYLIGHPSASLDKLMEFVPGPDLPTGGLLLGMDMVRQAYETGSGVVRIRAKASIGPLAGSRGKNAITVTELPYGTSVEKIIEGIQKGREEDRKKGKPERLSGISDIKDLSEGGEVHLVIEVKAGMNPSAVLAELYAATPLEVAFGINNTVMLEGRPQTLGLKRMLEVWVEHRLDVVTRRTNFRFRKAAERRHLVEGMLVALDNIDKVVKIIRSSADTAEAKARLVAELKNVKVVLGGQPATRGLDETQATHILEMPLRRLVNLEVDSLRIEWDTLTATMAGLQAILDDEKVLRKVVTDELAAVAKAHAVPRRTALMDGDLKEVLAASAPVAPAEVKDDPCQVMLSTTGLLARTAAASEEAPEAGRSRFARSKHDTVTSIVDATARGKVLLVTNRGRAFRIDVLGLQVLPPASAGNVTLTGMPQAGDFATGLASGEKVIALSPVAPALGIALGTATGQVMVCKPDWPVREDEWVLIKLGDEDELVGATPLTDGTETLVFVTEDASLLRFDAGKVRPQGRGSGGMAGVSLTTGSKVMSFQAVRTDDDTHGEPLVVTSTGGSVKVTPLVEYPAKGRATGGVRCHRFLKTENRIKAAWVGPRPVGATKQGDPVELPDVDRRRDGSGTAAFGPDLIGHLVSRQ